MGPQACVESIRPRIMEVLGARGGGKGGKLQGKAVTMANLAEAQRIVLQEAENHFSRPSE